MYPGSASKNEMHPKKVTPLLFNEKSNIVMANPPVNICETGTEYLMLIAAPGLQREDFCIEIEKGIIAVSAKRLATDICITNDRCEYDYTDWTRAFSLPTDADEVLAHAKYKKGELIIRIPRGNTISSKEIVTVYVC